MNNLDDVLQYTDDLIDLTPIQEAILKGTWERKKFFQIAQDFNCSESHIKKEAAKLWKKLGQELGENINKDNVRSKLEKKYRISQHSHFGNFLQVNGGNINICDQSLQNTDNEQMESFSSLNSQQSKKQSPIIDLTDAPELNYDYGREFEISTLKEWIDNKTRLITIYGLSGIGKTALVLKLISQIKAKYDYIFYQSIDDIPLLITLKEDLTNFFYQSQLTSLSKVIEYFKSFRCLVIFDDEHNIFKSEKLAGEYLKEYRDYSQFFKQIATKNHQSCLILISQEKSADIEILESQNKYVKTLQLQGLGESAKEIFREKSLKDEDKWDKLITLYQGNPCWLNIISFTINQLHNGNVKQFLTEENNLFIGDIKLFLQPHIERLSPLENQLINWLANQNKCINIGQILSNIELSNTELWEVSQSLLRRCLIEKVIIEEQFYLQLNTVFKEYLRRNNN